MIARDLLAAATRLHEEKRRMLDGGDTWSTRKINQIAQELGEVEVRIRDIAVNEYESLLDVEDAGRALDDALRFHEPSVVRGRIAQLRETIARLEALRSGT